MGEQERPELQLGGTDQEAKVGWGNQGPVAMVTTACLWLGSEGWGRWAEPEEQCLGRHGIACTLPGQGAPADGEACSGTLLGGRSASAYPFGG